MLILPRRGGSNEYPQSMFWRKNKENKYNFAYHSFATYKWGSKGYASHGHVFLMVSRLLSLYCINNNPRISCNMTLYVF